MRTFLVMLVLACGAPVAEVDAGDPESYLPKDAGPDPLGFLAPINKLCKKWEVGSVWWNGKQEFYNYCERF